MTVRLEDASACVVLTFVQARDEDIIRRKILEKIATFTTYSPLAYSHDGEPTESSDQDPSLINASDADSSGDGRVVAKSVEGEDDIVDVSMQDAPQVNVAPEDVEKCV